MPSQSVGVERNGGTSIAFSGFVLCDMLPTSGSFSIGN